MPCTQWLFQSFSAVLVAQDRVALMEALLLGDSCRTLRVLLTPSPHCATTLSLLRMEVTRFWRLSQRWLPSCTMCLSLLAESVRFSRARRRYCLLISSSCVRRSWICRWNACKARRGAHSLLTVRMRRLSIKRDGALPLENRPSNWKTQSRF